MSRNVLLFLVPLVPLFFDKIEADLFFKIQFEIKNTIDSVDDLIFDFIEKYAMGDSKQQQICNKYVRVIFPLQKLFQSCWYL